MDRLEHDPRTKQQIKDAMYGFLYGPVERQFKGRLDTLIQRNTVIGSYSHRHFSYRGHVYSNDSTPVPTRKNRLQTPLKAEMDAYLADMNELNEKELPHVLGFMNQVLNASCDLADYMRMFPESVHQPLNQLIATCPCRTSNLTPQRVETILSRNKESIGMIKRRLVMNLLI